MEKDASSWSGWALETTSWAVLKCLATTSLSAPWAALPRPPKRVSTCCSLCSPGRGHSHWSSSLDGTESCITTSPTQGSIDQLDSSLSGSVTPTSHRPSPSTCSICGAHIGPVELHHQGPPHLLGPAPDGPSIDTWLQLPPPQSQNHHLAHLLQATRKLVALGSKAAAAAMVIQSVLPHRLVRGSSLPGTALRTLAVVAAGSTLRRRWRRRAQLQGDLSDPSVNSTSQASALAVLGLPAWPWLNEDQAARLLTQTQDDVKQARERAGHTAAWREACGIDLLFVAPHAPHPAPHATPSAPSSCSSSSNRMGTWLTRRPTRHLPRDPAHNTHTPHSHAVLSQLPAEILMRQPAVQAAVRFIEMVPLVGTALLHIDDLHGLAVVWIRGSQLAHVRAGVTRLLSGASEQHSRKGSGGGKGQDAAWLQACAMHAALLTDWVWRCRLPGRPVAAGRSVQVMDLKGVRISSALVDSLAVMRAIMAAGHHFPQRLKAIIIINPPPGLSLAWRMVSQLLPQPVVAKVNMVRGGSAAVLKALRAYLPDDLIPTEYGGTCKLAPHHCPAQLELEAALAGEVARLTAG